MNQLYMNRKTYHLIALAALLFAGVAITACSSSDNEITEEVPSQSAKGKDTLLIKASKDFYATATTRDLSLDGNTLISIWSNNENVKVLKLIPQQMSHQEYWQVVGEVKVEKLSNKDLTCLLKGEFDAGTLNVGDYLRLVYPGKARLGSSYLIDYNDQLGTLESIASDLDYCSTPEQKKKAIRVTAIEGKNIIASDATFTSHQAIVHFTILDKLGKKMYPPYLTISAKDANGQEQIVTQEEITGESTMGMGPLQALLMPRSNETYVAMRGFKNKNFTLSAIYEGQTYTYTESNVTFENGKYYDMIVKMN